jgi:hypothetical protein
MIQSSSDDSILYKDLILIEINEDLLVIMVERDFFYLNEINNQLKYLPYDLIRLK